jgi:NADP-dependent aldehyde dehydrogenase
MVGSGIILVYPYKVLKSCHNDSYLYSVQIIYAPMTIPDATLSEIDQALQLAAQAFIPYKKLSLQARRDFMHAIAQGLEAAAESLVSTADRETHLGAGRLRGELVRTCWQLRSYSDAALAGHFLDVRIDTADPSRKPAPRPDIRKMMVPLGPVVVFGSSNFPFAYSTAGGDTACALAAGCPVIVKAHPAHAETSEAVAGVILSAAAKCSLPKGVFTHIHGAAFETGKALVTHPLVKAVGFTGSTSGGKALFDLAAQRKEPIPVFSEMGSVNPVFLLPGKLEGSAKEVAAQYAASITQSVGQFCTNPGLLIGIKGASLQTFRAELGTLLAKIPPAPMLNPGIARAYTEKRQKALDQKNVQTIVGGNPQSTGINPPNEGVPTLAATSAEAFLANPLLHEEVFGPYSLLVECADASEMLAVALQMEGQLTSTLIATEEDWTANQDLVEAVEQHCGRLILNGVPTGVEVVTAMQHGGPYPATTDSRFTSVGADGIRRFTRPLCYQNLPDHLLPEAVQDSNPLKIWRLVNGDWTK